jgi:cell shape-determining protein MreC
MQIGEKSKKSKVLISILLVILILSGYSIFRIYNFKPLIEFEGLVLNLFSLIAKFFGSLANRVTLFFSTLVSISSTSKRIETLDYQIRLLKVKLSLSEQYIDENLRLKALLGIRNKYPDCIFASLISRDPLNLYNFVVDKGLKDGLKINKAVVYPVKITTSNSNSITLYQLIGRVYDITDNNAKILSILAPESKISGRVLRTNVLGTIVFDIETKQLYFEVRKSEARLKKGDVIVTSELSTLPKGLIIGIVREIEDTPSIYKKVYLDIPFDFYKITEVGII